MPPVALHSERLAFAAYSSNTYVGEMLSWRIVVSLPVLSAASLIVWIVGGLVADH